MLASELAKLLMQNPELHVCMEYIPYNGPPTINVTTYPDMNVVVLDYVESDETEWE